MKLPGILYNYSFLLASCLLPGAVYSADLEILFTDVESGDGTLRVAVYNRAEDFLSDDTFRAAEVAANEGSVRAVIEDLAAGEYAVLVYHDANGNGELDSNFIGIPKEGLGASNDAPARFGPPKYEDAKFELDASTLNIRIKMRY